MHYAEYIPQAQKYGVGCKFLFVLEQTANTASKLAGQLKMAWHNTRILSCFLKKKVDLVPFLSGIGIQEFSLSVALISCF